MGWLCCRPQGSEEYRRNLSRTPAAVGNVRESGEEASPRKQQKITEANRSINKPAVGTRETMYQRLVTVNGYVVANQLQFTNKQLRSQTRALIIRYNDVYIRDPQNHLTKFFYSVMGNKRLWI